MQIQRRFDATGSGSVPPPEYRLPTVPRETIFVST